MTARADLVDCFILGAGPAGAAAAIALRRAGIRHVLLAARPCAAAPPAGESASPVLSPLLRALGLDDRLDRRGHRPCEGYASLWGGGSPVATDFFRRAAGPGWHVDRSRFDAWLLESALGAGASLLRPARLAAVTRSEGLWRLCLAAEDRECRVSARWILDASGRPAALARRLGARLQRFDRLIALAGDAALRPGAGFQGFSQVEAVEQGWWYAARLPDGRATLMLMSDADLVQARGLHRPAAFRAAWRETRMVRGFAMPEAGGRGPTRMSAATQILDRACGEGWLALGDALMAFDPLSASGLTGALEDALAAARVVAAAFAGDLAGRRAAAAYARRARATFAGYRAARQGVYGQQTRWADAPFWRRRIAAGPAFGYDPAGDRPAA